MTCLLFQTITVTLKVSYQKGVCFCWSSKSNSQNKWKIDRINVVLKNHPAQFSPGESSSSPEEFLPQPIPLLPGKIPPGEKFASSKFPSVDFWYIESWRRLTDMRLHTLKENNVIWGVQVNESKRVSEIWNIYLYIYKTSIKDAFRSLRYSKAKSELIDY